MLELHYELFSPSSHCIIVAEMRWSSRNLGLAEGDQQVSSALVIKLRRFLGFACILTFAVATFSCPLRKCHSKINPTELGIFS